MRDIPILFLSHRLVKKKIKFNYLFKISLPMSNTCYLFNRYLTLLLLSNTKKPNNKKPLLLTLVFDITSLVKLLLLSEMGFFIIIIYFFKAGIFFSKETWGSRISTN